MSPFALTFGHDELLSLEIMMPSIRVARLNEQFLEYYSNAIIMELEEVDELGISNIQYLALQKQKVAMIYNIRVNKKIFQEGQILWKAILPLGTKNIELGKWSSN